MTYSAHWDALYSEGRHDSVWPWTDVVRLVHHHIPGAKTGLRVLEVGFGAAANIPFFEAIGADYHGIDGSASMVERARERFPKFADQLTDGDFTKTLGFDGPFDLILDRGALTCNTSASIARALAMIAEALGPEGRFIGVDWFSTEFTDMAWGVPTDDPFSRRDFKKGALANTGIVHFADQNHMRELFADFEIVFLEHRVHENLIPDPGYRIAAFNIVARS